MGIELDADKGRAKDSCIRLRDRGIEVPVSVEEVVTENEPLFRKVGETMGILKLEVIGHYKVGFEITPQGTFSLLRVFMNYNMSEPLLSVCSLRMTLCEQVLRPHRARGPFAKW